MLIFFFRSVLTEEYKVPDGMVGFSMYCLMSTFFFFHTSFTLFCMVSKWWAFFFVVYF